MAFWSGERLADELPGLIAPFDPARLDCASYRLGVGEQAFVTSDTFVSSAPSAPLVSVLGAPPSHTLRIRPGQFAFVLTEEVVEVPNIAIALISMRAKYKFKGLINVSGFHVDPGWRGKLLFSVYNAGPAEVILERSEPCFLIVFADLDRTTTKVYDGASQGQSAINTSLLQNMTEQVFSPLMLQRQMAELRSNFEGQRSDLLDKLRDHGVQTDRKLAEVVLQADTKLHELEAKATATAKTVGVVTWTVASAAALLFAALSYLAAIAPGWFGVTLAKVLQASGYEIREKPADRDLGAGASSSPSLQATGTTAPASAATANPASAASATPASDAARK